MKTFDFSDALYKKSEYYSIKEAEKCLQVLLCGHSLRYFLVMNRIFRDEFHPYRFYLKKKYFIQVVVSDNGCLENETDEYQAFFITKMGMKFITLMVIDWQYRMTRVPCWALKYPSQV
jgi:hypothetical protein